MWHLTNERSLVFSLRTRLRSNHRASGKIEFFRSTRDSHASEPWYSAVHSVFRVLRFLAIASCIVALSLPPFSDQCFLGSIANKPSFCVFTLSTCALFLYLCLLGSISSSVFQYIFPLPPFSLSAFISHSIWHHIIYFSKSSGIYGGLFMRFSFFFMWIYLFVLLGIPVCI